MKHVVSVSLGSSRRDHAHEIEFLGERVRVERRGTDGSLPQAIALIKELDGTVDCIGLGGIDLYIYTGRRRYTLRDALRMAEAARRTPIVDGSGLKNTLERWVVERLAEGAGPFSPQGRRVLLVSGVDRFGMAEALVAAGADVVFGDLAFILGVPWRLRSLRALAGVARLVAPIAVRLPIHVLYPTGKKQEQVTQRYGRFFDWAEWIAGDFHLIRRFMPDRLDGRVVLTNTITPADIEALRQRGVATLITTTPDLGGRSFGTNVMEALLVAISGRKPDELTPADYLTLIESIGFEPPRGKAGRSTRWA